MRWKEENFQKIYSDLDGLAFISKKYLQSSITRNAASQQLIYQPQEQLKEKLLIKPKVSMLLTIDKIYLQLPIPIKQEWLIFLDEIGGMFESRRGIWIFPINEIRKETIRAYFTNQGCQLNMNETRDAQIVARLTRHSYKEDLEIQSFIKAMTLQGACKRTIENYASQINKLKVYYNGKSLCDISDDEIRDYLFFIRQELGYSSSSQNIVVSAIKRYLLAITDRDFNSNYLPRPAKRKTLPKVLEKESIAALLKLDLNLKHKCILYLLYSTGIRCGELLNLRVEDVSFENNLIVVNKGKGEKDRIVFLSEKVKGLLLDYLKLEKPHVYFFEGQNGGKYSATSVQKVVKRAVQKAGINKNVTPHVLRHSFATHLHDSGVDIRNIQVLLGHSSTKTTEIYTYISKRDIRKLKSPLDDLDI
jgi:site-specific recombinase XerD